MKILVTGASGFLGRHLVPLLQARAHEVVALTSKTCDLTRDDALAKFSETRFDRIYHLAAWTQAGDFCDKRRGEQWIVNQRINTNLLAWWHEAQPQAKLIAFGTSVSYAKGYELIEDTYLAGEPYDRYAAYATTKRALLVGLQSLQKQFGHRYLYLVPSTLYGPGYPLDGRQLHFIYDLIRKILRGHLHGERVVLWGDGEQRRELVFVYDFVRWLLALDERIDNQLINLGAGEEYSIRQFAEIICKQVGYDPARIEYDTNGFVGARSKSLSTVRLDHFLPDRPRTPLAEGLRATIDWFRARPAAGI